MSLESRDVDRSPARTTRPGEAHEKAIGHRRTDAAAFLRSCFENPMRAGAVAPSGPELARAMAARVDPSTPGQLIELGPGTGAVTSALIERGVHPSRLVLVEMDGGFCERLRKRWPQALVLHADAYRAPSIMRALAQPAFAIVAGLPLILRPPHERLRLVLGCLRQAVPGAPFLQFTYFLRSPVPAPRPGLRAKVSPMIWRNLWPARVWTYRLVCGSAAADALR